MEGDNGAPAANTASTETKVRVLTIYIDKVTQRVEIEGLLSNKQLCLNALGEAIKTVANFDPPKIVSANVGVPGRMMNFARKITGRH